MSTGRELPRDAQDPSRFAPTWIRDPEQGAGSRRSLRADGDIWLGDAEEAANDGFRRGGDGQLGLFAPPLEPIVMPRTRPLLRRHSSFLFVVAGLIVATPALIAIGHVGKAGGERAAAPNELVTTQYADRASMVGGRLVVLAPTSPFLNNEAVPLGLAVHGAARGSKVVIGGYVSGSRFSVGGAIGPGTWGLNVSQLDGVVMAPPLGFTGAMEVIFELRLADGSVVDRKRSRLEWSAPPMTTEVPPVAAVTGVLSGPHRPTGSAGDRRRLAGARVAPIATPGAPSPTRSTPIPRKLSAAELGALLKRGNELVARGDLAGARLVFERAAEAGESSAALALASTYDPRVLEQLGERGLAPDIAMARFWYQKAKELGSKEAPERLEVLVSRSN
jgi:hypothetical protein